MPYVITTNCADVKDRTCVRECPVDCIYEGERALYINPDECIDCGACEPVCPSKAVFYEAEVPPEFAAAVADNAAFFSLPLLPEGPIGNPGGAREFGPRPVDTPLVAGLPRPQPTPPSTGDDV